MESVLTLAQLRALMPNLSEAKATLYRPALTAAMRERDILTLRRTAAFLAQLALESGELRYFRELATGEAYEGRLDLGNTEPGDGVRYKGRGPIQLTGRANYRAAGRALNLPLEAQPELVETPAVGFRVAAWFWESRQLNHWADMGTVESFREITRRINGGRNGLEQREAYHRRAQQVFGGVS